MTTPPDPAPQSSDGGMTGVHATSEAGHGPASTTIAESNAVMRDVVASHDHPITSDPLGNAIAGGLVNGALSAVAEGAAMTIGALYGSMASGAATSAVKSEVLGVLGASLHATEIPDAHIPVEQRGNYEPGAYPGSHADPALSQDPGMSHVDAAGSYDPSMSHADAGMSHYDPGVSYDPGMSHVDAGVSHYDGSASYDPSTSHHDASSSVDPSTFHADVNASVDPGAFHHDANASYDPGTSHIDPGISHY